MAPRIVKRTVTEEFADEDSELAGIESEEADEPDEVADDEEQPEEEAERRPRARQSDKKKCD